MKIDEHETTPLGEECGAVVLNKLPAQLKDPNSFFIPCLIRNVSIYGILSDLGSSVSLMPYFIFKKLDLGASKLTTISHQLANHSLKYHLGILEDVPTKMGDFYVLVDFVIFDMAENAYTQIILERPFWPLQVAK